MVILALNYFTNRTHPTEYQPANKIWISSTFLPCHSKEHNAQIVEKETMNYQNIGNNVSLNLYYV